MRPSHLSMGGDFLEPSIAWRQVERELYSQQSTLLSDLAGTVRRAGPAMPRWLGRAAFCQDQTTYTNGALAGWHSH